MKVLGRTMEVYTDSIGVQFYAGNFIEKKQLVKKIVIIKLF